MNNYLIWILAAALYSPVFHYLYSKRWDSVDYTHAYFILPISLWLVWRKRTQIKELFHNHDLKEHHNIIFLPILFFGLVMFIFGWRQDYIFISTLSLIPSLVGIIGYLYGTKILKLLSFPIFYILLLVPPPFGIIDSLTLPMRHGVSVIAQVILEFFNYPITRKGLLLSIGYHELFMGAPCSGFRSLITIFSLMLVWVYIYKGNLLKKFVLISFITPLALIGNVIRIIALCLITFYFGEEAGQGFFHNFSGIVIFVITLTGLLGVESFLDRLKIVNK